MLQYIQDYDEIFPPCAQKTNYKGVLSGWAAAHDEAGQAATVATPGNLTSRQASERYVSFILEPYVNMISDFACPVVRVNFPENLHRHQVTYMYNDLAAGVAQKDFAAPDKTVLVCDGEDFAGNVGHAYDPNNLASAPQFSRDGAVVFGATLQTAPIRHNGGANYGFVDGHVKWSKPGKIHFPFRQNDNRSHIDKHNGEALGPDPTRLAPLGYIGTFNVK